MKILVASKNPVKAEAARRGVAMMFPNVDLAVETASVPSGVSDQPMSEHETRLGAYNRVKNLMATYQGYDLYIGIEGGCAETTDVRGRPQLDAFAWVVISDGEGKLGEARAANFYLPPVLANLVRQGLELGLADDKVFGLENSKQKGGTIGTLTGGAVDRTAYYIQVVALALIAFKNSELYAEGKITEAVAV